MKSSSVVRKAALLSLAAAASATPEQKCLSNNVCYSLSIPDSTAKSGSGDIFFQITAPTSFSWVALGQGSQMSGSNIFVMYTSSDGNNVTISPRTGTGHVMPQFDSSTSLTLLDGSGVSGNTMTANVKCSNCNSWNGGTMNFAGTGNSNWIYAYKTGSPLNSDDVSQSIAQHDTGVSFQWSLASAQGGADSNPFFQAPVASTPASTSTVASTAASSAATTAATTGTETTAAASSTPASGTATSSAASSTPTCASGYQYANGGCQLVHGSPTGPPTEDSNPFNGDAAFGNRITVIHGTLASLAFVGIFPIGGILIRIASFTGLIWVHAALQLFAYALYFVAFGMGAYLMSQIGGTLSSHAHPAIGGLLFLVLLTQPLTGAMHHRMFKRNGGRRGAWSHAHLYIGRVAILLGIVNGGLGIALVGDVATGGKVAYAIFAVLMSGAYIASIVVGEARLKRRRQFEAAQGTRMHDLTPGVEGVQQAFPKQGA